MNTPFSFTDCFIVFFGSLFFVVHGDLFYMLTALGWPWVAFLHWRLGAAA